MNDEFRLHIEYPAPPQHLLYECLISGPFTEKFLESQKCQNIRMTPWNVGQHHKEQQREIGYDVPFYSHLIQQEVVFRVIETQKHFLTREKEVVFISSFSCQKIASPEAPSPFVWVCEWTVKPSSPNESNCSRFLGEGFTGKLDAKALSNLLSHCTIEGKVKKPIFARGGKEGGIVEVMEFATGWTEGHTKAFMKCIENHFRSKDAYSALSSKISGNFDYLESVYTSDFPSPSPSLPPTTTSGASANGGGKTAMFEMTDDEQDEEDEEIGSLVGAGEGVQQAEEDAGSESSIHSFLANSPHQQSKIHTIQQEMTQLKGLVLSGRGDTQSLAQRIQTIESELSNLNASSSSSSPPPLPSARSHFSSPSIASSPRSLGIQSIAPLPPADGGERVDQLQRQITLSRQRDIEIQQNTSLSLNTCQNDLQKQWFFIGGVAVFALCWPIFYSFIYKSGPRFLATLKSRFDDFFQS